MIALDHITTGRDNNARDNDSRDNDSRDNNTVGTF